MKNLLILLLFVSFSALSQTQIGTNQIKNGAVTNAKIADVAVGKITGLGTGVGTALGVNVGSAGAPVLFNGAGGTPSSVTLTNGTGLPLTTGVTGILPTANGGTGNANGPARVYSFAMSDQLTPLTTGEKYSDGIPYAMTVTGVKCNLKTAQASGSIFTIDIFENGVSILSTRITIDNTETNSTTAVTAPVISDTSIAADAIVSGNVHQVGASTTATGCKCHLTGY